MNNDPMIPNNNDYKNGINNPNDASTSPTNEAVPQKSKNKYLIAIVGILLVCATGISAYYLGVNSKTTSDQAKKSQAIKSGKKSQAKKSLKIYGINETAAINDIKYTLTSAKVTPAPSNVSVDNGMKCITVQLKIENSGTQSISYDTSAVRAVVLKNKSKDEKPFLNQSELKSGQLDAGKSVEVPLLFVVPTGSSQFRIMYRDTINKDTLMFKVNFS
jgi:hypothetical protein